MSGDDAHDSGPREERLQALLARAAEEQLSEQRQVLAVLGELRVLVQDLADRVGGQLDGVQARLDGVQTRLDALATDVQAAPRGAAPPTAEAVAAVVCERLVDAVGARLAELLRQEVADAVADSERRLTEHVDEAVLALAGVLLRRSPQRPAPAAAPRDEDAAAG